MMVNILSLKDACLNVVVKNFALFNYMYNSQNIGLCRHLEFLQRVYTAEIISKLSVKRQLKDEYASFLINKYLKELDLDKFFDCSSEPIIKCIAEFGHVLVKLSCGIHPPKDLLPEMIVEYLSNVNILHLPYICTDEALKIIAKSCPNLNELDVQECLSVTDEGLKSLCLGNENDIQANYKLRALNLEGTKVKKDDVAFLLENMPSLEILNYKSLPKVLYAIHHKDLEGQNLSKSRNYNLTKLDILNCSFPSENITDVLNICLTLCPHIKEISVPVSQPEHLDLCSKFAKLERVSVESENQSPHIDLNNFFKLKGSSLRKLTIHDFSFSASILLQSCPKLEMLNLRKVDFQSIENDISIPLRNLKEFSVEKTNFSDDFSVISVNLLLKSNPKLISLNMINCKFSESEMTKKLADYCANCTLEHVDMSLSDIQLPLLETILLTCTSLQSLTVYGCETITEEDIDILTETASTLKNLPEIFGDLTGPDSDLSGDESDYDYDDFGDELSDDYDMYDTDDHYCDDDEHLYIDPYVDLEDYF